jgi:transcriptional adapter 2-alpha
MQEARAAGCRTAAEANRFLEQKWKMEAEESEHGIKESAQGPSGKVLQRPNSLKEEFDASPRGVVKGSTGLQLSSKDSSSAIQAISSDLDEWDITGFVGADLLSETVRMLFSISMLYHGKMVLCLHRFCYFYLSDSVNLYNAVNIVRL